MFAPSEKVAIHGLGAVVDGVPVVEATLDRLLAERETLLVRLDEHLVVDVVVLLQGTLGPLDEPGHAGTEVVTQHGLSGIVIREVLGELELLITIFSRELSRVYQSLRYLEETAVLLIDSKIY